MTEDNQKKVDAVIEDEVAHRNQRLREAAERLMWWQPEFGLPTHSAFGQKVCKEERKYLEDAEREQEEAWRAARGVERQKLSDEHGRIKPAIPFFSEAYLYNLLGKEDARTLLALMRPVWEAAGIDPMEQP